MKVITTLIPARVHHFSSKRRDLLETNVHVTTALDTKLCCEVGMLWGSGKRELREGLAGTLGEGFKRKWGLS